MDLTLPLIYRREQCRAEFARPAVIGRMGLTLALIYRHAQGRADEMVSSPPLIGVTMRHDGDVYKQPSIK